MVESLVLYKQNFGLLCPKGNVLSLQQLYKEGRTNIIIAILQTRKRKEIERAEDFCEVTWNGT